MAQVNYSHQKRQKELATKKRQQEKMKEKLARKQLADQGISGTIPNEDSSAG